MAEELTFEKQTIESFVSLLSFCLQSDPFTDDYVKLVLAGRIDDNQAVISPSTLCLVKNEPFIKRRHYDAIIGISNRIDFDRDITINPFLSNWRTLTRNIHLTHEIYTSEGQAFVPVHRIPNLVLGQASRHSWIHVLLPALYSKDRTSSFLTEAEFRVFYNHGLRPAIGELLGAEAQEWPSTLTYVDQLMIRSGIIRKDLAGLLAQAIRVALSKGPYPQYADGLEILHQVRGRKACNEHGFGDDAEELLRRFLLSEGLSLDCLLNTGRWWVDVGAEYSDIAGRCLTWQTDCHTLLVQAVLDVPRPIAVSLSEPGSSTYTRDFTCRLTDFSGFQLQPGSVGRGPHHVAFLQLYGADKSFESHFTNSGRFSEFISCNDLLSNQIQDLLLDLYLAYIDAADGEPPIAQIRVRTELKFAADILLNIPDPVIAMSLGVIPADAFWNLCAHQVAAYAVVLERQSNSSGISRGKNEALLLSMAVVWLINGLFSALDTGPAYHDLLGLVLPRIQRDDADVDQLAFGTPLAFDDDQLSGDATAPGYPWGMVFLSPISLHHRWQPVPQMERTPDFVTAATFHHFWCRSLHDLLQHSFNVDYAVPLSPLRLRYTPRLTLDVRYAPPLHNEDSAPGYVRRIWRQALEDIARKAPCGRMRNMYISEATFRNPNFAGLFYDCVLKPVTGEEWTRSFTRIFPSRTTSLSLNDSQQYFLCPYYRMWTSLVLNTNISDTALKTYRAKLKEWFDALYWIPDARADRIWSNRYKEGFMKYSLEDVQCAAPRIFYRSSIGEPQWTEN